VSCIPGLSVDQQPHLLEDSAPKARMVAARALVVFPDDWIQNYVGRDVCDETGQLG